MLDLPGLQLRAALLRAVRSFFFDRGFLEVDTPVRLPVSIPESTIAPLRAAGQFLQTSPEICMKRLLARGVPRLFQLCSCFRAEERGRFHLEEFTMLEWYRADADYRRLMEDCRDLLDYLLAELRRDRRWREVLQHSCLAELELTGDWQELTVAQAFSRFAPVSLEQALGDGRFEELLVEYVEPRLGQAAPCLLYDYPAAQGSLARSKPGAPEVVERFELYLRGLELANGFSELTDPVEQRRRFDQEIARISKQGGQPPAMPERFLEDLARLDSAAGIALGVDRLLMLVTSADSIDLVRPISPEDW